MEYLADPPDVNLLKSGNFKIEVQDGNTFKRSS